MHTIPGIPTKGAGLRAGAPPPAGALGGPNPPPNVSDVRSPSLPFGHRSLADRSALRGPPASCPPPPRSPGMRDGAALLLVLLVLVAVPGRGGLRVAICNPTLYGNVTLAALDKYARYHRGLGFAEAFVYVGKGSTPRHAKEYLRRSPFFRPVLHPHMVGNEHGQDRAIRHCHNLTRMLGYDWAMFSDLDEFVQWNRSALSVGEWLAADFRSKTIGCFTLGKRFFTGVYRAPSYRGLAAFPFTPPTPYCYGGRRGYDHNVCDGWRGRRKPFLRLSHPKAFVVGVHGCLCRGCTKVCTAGLGPVDIESARRGSQQV